MKRYISIYMAILIFTAFAGSAVFFCRIPKNAFAQAFDICFVCGDKKLYVSLDGDFRERGTTLEEKIQLAEQVRALGFDARISLNYVFPSLGGFVEKLKGEVELPPVEASASMSSQNGRGIFTFTQEKKGLRVDEQRLYDLLFVSLSAGKKTVKVPLAEVEPKLTRSDLEQDTHERSSFFTMCNASNYPRVHNIKLALSSINGCVIAPGEVFSFNGKVGRRSRERGYMNSTVIYKGEYAEGVGGGVCQVSGTLYNAALLADLPVVERNRHTLKSSYLEAGFDAMVSDDGADLRFKNNTGGFLYLLAEYESGRVLIRIYGRDNPYEIERESVVLHEYKKGSLLSESYLIYTLDGERMKRIKLHRDYYYPNPHYVD